MHTMQLVLPLIHTAAVRAIFRGPKDPHMDIRIIDAGNFDFAEEVQAVCGIGDAHGFEVLGGEGGEVGVREGGDGAEVFGLVF
jgi:hypothetical protein